jgi:hypothetical protein
VVAKNVKADKGSILSVQSPMVNIENRINGKCASLIENQDIQTKIVKKSINFLVSKKHNSKLWYPNMDLKPLRGSKLTGSPQPKKIS